MTRRTHASPTLGLALAGLLVFLASCTSDQPTVASPTATASATAPSVAAVTPPVTVKACPGLDGVRCGSIHVPLYWSQGSDPATDLQVAFRIFDHTDDASPALEPLVGFEGGPGYGSIDSAASYLAMMGSLHEHHDLIVMDQRGTGASGAIDCPALQRGVGTYEDLVAACARSLGDAANAYGSAAAADDLHAILQGLHIPQVDLYGDSYGTYLAQVVALHHPEDVRAVVLDGSYDQSFAPFARAAVAASRRAWTDLCARNGTCPDVLNLFGSYARTLAAHPLTGIAPGTTRPVTLTADGLAQMVYDAAYVFTIYRDLPAAITSAKQGDTAPLLRLASEDLASTGNGSNPKAYSAGLYMAVSCHDYPTIWDPSASMSDRADQLDAAIAGLGKNAFAPFDRDAYLHSLYEDQLVYGCLKWPAPTVADPAFIDGPRSNVPVLVLDGELDVTTPLSNAQHAADSWPNATLVETSNEVHISALYDFENCASVIVQRFIRSLSAGDTSCASQIPDVEIMPSFPVHLAQAPQAASAGGADRSTAADRQAAWVAAQTVGDAFTRWYNVTFGGRGDGLRGGDYMMRGPYQSHQPLTITFHGTKLVDDLTVTGPVVWNRETYGISGTLTLDGAVSGELTIRFPTQVLGGKATISGTIDGRQVRVTTAAPWGAP